ncbi:MAG: methyltransferase [Candidatus Buchananbacteria bacterium]
MDDQITPEPLKKLTTSMWAFWTLLAGVKLNIFEYTMEKSTAEEVANKLNIDADPAERLLNALVAMELIEKQDDSYINLPIANKFLIKSHPDYFGDFILMYEESAKYWIQLAEILIANKPIIKSSKEWLSEPFFTRAMHNNAKIPANILSEIFDFSKKTHLLDIGAGGGTFSIILTNKFPNLKATTIEQEEVCKIINENIEKEGDANKIDVIGGDFLKLDFPAHDVALFAHIFHAHSIEENKLLLKKVYDKLPNDGTVIITEFLMNEDKAGPLFSALFALNMKIDTEDGNAYTFNQIKGWLGEIGFKNIESKQLIGPQTAIIAEK